MELTIELRARSGKFQELYQTLQALLPTIRKAKGCRDCRMSSEVDNGAIFFLAVRWGAFASLEHYMQSVSGTALLGAIEVLSETARVKFSRDSPWHGIDSLKRMREKTAK